MLNLISAACGVLHTATADGLAECLQVSPDDSDAGSADDDDEEDDTDFDDDEGAPSLLAPRISLIQVGRASEAAHAPRVPPPSITCASMSSSMWSACRQPGTHLTSACSLHLCSEAAGFLLASRGFYCTQSPSSQAGSNRRLQMTTRCCSSWSSSSLAAADQPGSGRTALPAPAAPSCQRDLSQRGRLAPAVCSLTELSVLSASCRVTIAPPCRAV